MAPAGVFWAAAGARVAFWCARGKGGGVMVLLGAKEGGKELGQGRNVDGGRSADGSELRRARGGGVFWPFKANQGRRGRRFGGRWRAALMAGRGQRLGRCKAISFGRHGGIAARRRVFVACGALVDGAEGRRLRRDGGGKVSGAACRRALNAGHRARGQRRSEARAGALKCLRARREGRVSEGEGGEREREWREKARVKALT